MPEVPRSERIAPSYECGSMSVCWMEKVRGCLLLAWSVVGRKVVARDGGGKLQRRKQVAASASRVNLAAPQVTFLHLSANESQTTCSKMTLHFCLL